MVRVVMRSAATDAAFWRASLATFAGSMMPALIMSTYSPLSASKPKAPFFSRTFSAITDALVAGILCDLFQRLLDGLADDLDPVAGIPLELCLRQCACAAHQGHASARHDALLDGRAGCVESVVDAGLLFLHLDLRGGADLDDRNAAGDLGQALHRLLAIVVLLDDLDFLLELLDPFVDVRFFARAVDEGRVVLVDDDPTGPAEVLDGGRLQLDPHFLGDDLAPHDDGDVLQGTLAPVAEVRGLDGGALEHAAHLVDDERCQGFAFHVLGNDHERLAGLRHLLEQRQNFLHVVDFLVGDQDVGVFQDGLHLLHVRDEVGGDEPPVESHPLDVIEDRVEGLVFLDGDDALLADLVHGIGDDLSDLRVVVGRNRADLGDFLLVLYRLGDLLELFGNQLDAPVDPLLEFHGVHARRHELCPLAVDGLGKDRRRRRAVAGLIGGLGGDFLNHHGAHVLEGCPPFRFPWPP